MAYSEIYSSIPGPDRWRGLGEQPLTPDELLRITEYLRSEYGAGGQPAVKETELEPYFIESE